MTSAPAMRAPADGGETSNLAPLGGKSHVVGDRSVPLLETTIPALLAATVARHGPREAAVWSQDRRFSWNELAGAVDGLAAGLLSLGLQPGDRIGIWSPNRSGMAGHAVRNGPLSA